MFIKNCKYLYDNQIKAEMQVVFAKEYEQTGGISEKIVFLQRFK